MTDAAPKLDEPAARPSGDSRASVVSVAAAEPVEDEASACAATLRERAEEHAGICLRIALGYYVCATFLLPLVLESPLFARLSMAGHIAAAVGIIAGHFGVFQRGHFRAHYALSQATFMAGLSGYVHFALVLVPNTGDATLYAVSYLLLTIAFVVTFPFAGRALAAATAGCALLAVFAYWPSADFGVWTWLEAASAALAVVLTWSMRRREAHLAVAEYRNLEFATKAAQVRYEHELELAREIQDSLAPPRSLTLPSGDRLSIYQQRHARVGGDWVAMRRTATGELVLVIADATGKGMQAALVVHAVQSLWADSLHDRDFHPVTWLARLNRMLLTLGERTPHSLTLGVAVIGRTRLVYWSAGHWPLYVLRGPGPYDAAAVTVVPARGSLLGIGREVQFQPGSHDLSPDGEVTILLATDGLLDALPRHKTRALARLLPELEARGEAAFSDYPVNDDLTLVCLRRGRPRG